MKKTVISLLVILSLMLSFIAFADGEAEETLPARTEIAFRVGDDVLVINGEDVKVETAPYVVGVGVTLVPVRVITEAFGAKVGWEEATETVTLDYPDVNIVLQIGNPVAEVNGKAETLLAAPELSPEGRTMIPLRFISENFGAVVTYDDETEAITVVKETAQEGGILEGRIEEPFVGDSYYGWSMENPTEFKLEYRSANGRTVRFLDEQSKSLLTVDFAVRDKDFNLEKRFEEEKTRIVSEYTLVGASLGEKDGNRFAEWLYRNDELYYAVRLYDCDPYTCMVFSGTVWSETEKKARMSALMDSFTFIFDESDTYDLSDVDANGNRPFESEDLGFKLAIPATFGDDTDKRFNVYELLSLENDGFIVEVYSDGEFPAPLDFATALYDHNMRGAKKELVKIDTINEMTYGGVQGARLDMEYRYENGDGAKETYFFCKHGGYAYKFVVVDLIKKDETAGLKPTEILKTLEFTEPDAEKVGILLFTDSDHTLDGEEAAVKTIDDRFTLDVPKCYVQDTTVEKLTNSVFYAADNVRHNYILISKRDSLFKAIKDATGRSTLRDLAEYVTKTYENNGGVSLTGNLYGSEKLGAFNVYRYSFRMKRDDPGKKDYFIDGFLVEIGDSVYSIETSYSELYNTDEMRDEFVAVAKTLKKTV